MKIQEWAEKNPDAASALLSGEAWVIITEEQCNIFEKYPNHFKHDKFFIRLDKSSEISEK